MPFIIKSIIAVVLLLSLIFKLFALEYSREDVRPLLKYNIIVSSVAIAIILLQWLSGGAE